MHICSLQIKKSPDAKFIQTKKLRVKITGDGTRIGKRLHIVHIAFTILEEGEKAYFGAGNHCIAIIREPEFYGSLKPAIQDIITDLLLVRL